jgi:hypothetical protein
LGKKLYVGNLSYTVDQERTRTALFAAHGTVVSAQVITDRETGRKPPCGGLVSMAVNALAYMRAIIASPNSEQDTSVAPSIRRAKS